MATKAELTPLQQARRRLEKAIEQQLFSITYESPASVRRSNKRKTKQCIDDLIAEAQVATRKTYEDQR